MAKKTKQTKFGSKLKDTNKKKEKREKKEKQESGDKGEWIVPQLKPVSSVAPILTSSSASDYDDYIKRVGIKDQSIKKPIQKTKSKRQKQRKLEKTKKALELADKTTTKANKQIMKKDLKQKRKNVY
eukprot:TRINITY_DN1335_c2_g1_i1.p1 TRINITY_DN1335_c2_g1~~TRINITY_DN1335_c2_g1_i1.p1  ORF type:complete len:141 (-),score=46.66 TRINITY_DN1335_c2_g1_i1:176-556(-)